MKGKKRGRTNPLAEYRRVQREIRDIFDPFTAKHCPTCTTPCCIKPTKVTPFDVALAIGTGHTFPHLGDVDPYEAAFNDAGHRLSSATIELPVIKDNDELIPCEYLDKGRCTFPDNLRPYGCTTYLCKIMYANMPEETIRRLRRLIRQLETAHISVLNVLQK